MEKQTTVTPAHHAIIWRIHPQNTPFFFNTHAHTHTQNRAAASGVWCRKCSISSSGEGCDIWPQGFNERLCVWVCALAYVFVCVCGHERVGSERLFHHGRTSPDCVNGPVRVCAEDAYRCQRASNHLCSLISPIATPLTLCGRSSPCAKCMSQGSLAWV